MSPNPAVHLKPQRLLREHFGWNDDKNHTSLPGSKRGFPDAAKARKECLTIVTVVLIVCRVPYP